MKFAVSSWVPSNPLRHNQNGGILYNGKDPFDFHPLFGVVTWCWAYDDDPRDGCLVGMKYMVETHPALEKSEIEVTEEMWDKTEATIRDHGFTSSGFPIYNGKIYDTPPAWVNYHEAISIINYWESKRNQK